MRKSGKKSCANFCEQMCDYPMQNCAKNLLKREEINFYMQFFGMKKKTIKLGFVLVHLLLLLIFQLFGNIDFFHPYKI